MGWTDVFPVFTEEMVDDFEAQATLEERAELENWYGTERVLNEQPDKRDIVSVSLFWKNVLKGDPELPTPTREILQNAQEMGLAKRFNPWDHYVRPLLELVPSLIEKFPDAVVRVHLAKDMEFLAEELAEAGNEVRVMKSSSIHFAPAGLWRFLPFSESGKRITVTDIDRLNELEGDLLRSKTMEQAGLGFWRVPNLVDLTGDRQVSYLPFIGCQFGVQGGQLNVRLLLDAFTWYATKGLLDPTIVYPACGPLVIERCEWPSYGFDEFFMTLAAYPRLAQRGALTFVPAFSKSQILALDVEYVTWGNPNSELVYFSAESCCGVRREIPPQGQEEEAAREVSENTVIDFPRLHTSDRSEVPELQEPKVGFLFFSIGEPTHPEIWSEYFDEASEDGFAVFSHSKGGEILDGEPHFPEQIGESAPADWSDVFAVKATLSLLSAALRESNCTHFMLISDSCVPVRPFHDLARSLKLDPRSRMRVYPWDEVRKWNILKAQRLENLTGIRKELAHFHDRWMCLSREDAELILATDRMEAFAGVAAPGEAYFATVLAASGRSPLQAVANRPVTWTEGHEGGKHSESFTKVSARIAAQIAESGCFFARKFPATSDIGRWELHRSRIYPETRNSGKSDSEAVLSAAPVPVNFSQGVTPGAR